MSKFSLKKITALIMALVLILSVTVVGSFAEQTVAPLFTISDIDTNQGEQFDVEIKFAQDISPAKINIAALDVSLIYNSNVYTPVSMTKGAGLEAAFEKLSGSSALHLETGDYIFGCSMKEAGAVNWSLSTLEGFTFQKGSEFAVVTFKAKDVSSLEGELAMTIKVTNAATKEYTDTTALYKDVKNTAKIDVNLAKLCNWELNSDGTAYTLAKYNDTNATRFTIPDTYKEGKITKELPVTKVKVGAFAECEKMQEVVFGSNIETVDSGAFFNCENLKRVTFYSNNARIGEDAFFGSMKNLIVKCRKGSTAEEFAKDNKLTIEYLGDVNTLTYTGLDEVKTYNDGKPVKLTKLKFTDTDGKTLVEGTDYTLTYENNTKVGTATVHVTGKGNYSGTRDLKFQIGCPYHIVGSDYYTETKVYEDCTKGGYVEKFCAFCGYHNTDEKLPAKAHVADEKIGEAVIKEATCAEEGKKAYTCADCKATFGETVIEKKAHVFGWKVTTEPTCEAAGEESWQCLNCGALDTCGVKTQAVEQKTHTMEYVVTKEATCTENGLKELMCPYCREKSPGGEAQVIAAKGSHTPESEWKVVKASTCTTKGTEALYCKDCGEQIETREIALAAHVASNKKMVVVPPTCTDDGYIVYYCDVCGVEMGQKPTRVALGHDWSEYGVIEEPTCETSGKKGCVCATCGAEKELSVIPATDHNYSASYETIKAATCTEPGLEGIQCKTCGKVKPGYSHVISATGSHSYGLWSVVVPATCLEEGFKQRTCSKCGEVEIEVIKQTGHKKVYVADVLPTYKYTGLEKLVCEYCGLDFHETRTAEKIVPDLDGDKKITATDALMILQHATDLITLKDTALKNADCNGDAKVNSTDALLVLQLATGLISA